MVTLNKAVLVMVLVLAFSLPALAFSIPSNDNGKDHSFDNGKDHFFSHDRSRAMGPDWTIDRVDYILYAKSIAPARAPKPAPCYTLMGNSWKTAPITYIINPTNSQGLSQSFITSTISKSAETWDAATSKELFNNKYSIDYSAQSGIMDGKNTITFEPYPNNGIIAVTSVWVSRINNRTVGIVEFDQLYNTNLTWGNATVDANVTDLQNIATHELGHAVGLDDIYSSTCTSATMYGYSTVGETSKRTLESGDIAGLRSMYG